MQELDAERKQNELQAIHAKLLKELEEANCKKIMVEISRFSFILNFHKMSRFSVGVLRLIPVYNC